MCAIPYECTGLQVTMADGVDACRVALADVERRVRKYAEEDPTELEMQPLEEGQAPADQKRSLTKQEVAITKLEAVVVQLQTVLVSGCTMPPLFRIVH